MQTPLDCNPTLSDLLEFEQSIQPFRSAFKLEAAHPRELPLKIVSALPTKPSRPLADLRQALPLADKDLLAYSALLYLYRAEANWHRRDEERSSIFARLAQAHPAFRGLAPNFKNAGRMQGKYLVWLDDLESRHDVRAAQHLQISEADAHRALCQLRNVRKRLQQLAEHGHGIRTPVREKLESTILHALSTRLHDASNCDLTGGGRFALNSFELMLAVWRAAMFSKSAAVQATYFPSSSRKGFGSLGEAALRELSATSNGPEQKLANVTRFVVLPIPEDTRAAFVDQQERGVTVLEVEEGTLDLCRRDLPSHLETPDLVLVTGEACYHTVHIDCEKRIGRGHLYTDQDTLSAVATFFAALKNNATPLKPQQHS